MAKVVLDRPSVANTGSFWIGRLYENFGVPEAGFDNFQLHNRALTSGEIQSAVAGNIIYNKNLIIAYDFNDGVVDGQVKDLSNYGHHANVWELKPIKLIRSKLTSPAVEIYTKCYGYGSTSWKVTIIIILIVIVVLTVLTSIYCFY